MAIELEPIGFVRSTRVEVGDDDWDRYEAGIELAPGCGVEALTGIEEFSHLEVLFVFDRVPPDRIERGACHPRENRAWPRVGIFAQRRSARPNRLGATIVEFVARAGRMLEVRGLDALDGTPVVDIKPVLA